MKQAAATSWMDAANALAEILQAENAALRAIDFAAATALLPAKRAALQAIELLSPKGPKQLLAQTIRQLELLVAENRDLLAGSIGVQSRVLGIIADATRVAGTIGYGSGGQSTIRGGAMTLSEKA